MAEDSPHDVLTYKIGYLNWKRSGQGDLRKYLTGIMGDQITFPRPMSGADRVVWIRRSNKTGFETLIRPYLRPYSRRSSSTAQIVVRDAA